MIRLMKQDELKQVMQIWLSANIEAHDFISTSYWQGNYDLIEGMLPKAEVFVNVENGNINGFVGLMDNYIAGIFVAQNARSKGVGKQLLDHAKIIRNELTLYVYQLNQRAIVFYEREGFKITNTGIDEDTGQNDYEMAWHRK
ncbi:acetyltransferase [Secundilactobacillus oryzae JCM 18671]|uniref:Acetyltransferase n=1 Tax=Secundilactobacillus oryzae JCM 18671 TaxID=1291743 RepID=A0A081BHK9_9LACO|nr:GNAT family N-acetyltransferase [Secundilactobacillus oryzae]GAK47527.1 acetyltransferase [Secundilactobacillus oryzae JCM 18671]